MDADGLRRLAGQTAFDVATLEKDYALTWLVHGIYAEDSPLADTLIFKGGTAIRMVHSPEWRLSEDLDFTILRDVKPDTVRDDVERVFVRLRDRCDVTYTFSQYHAQAYVILARVQFLGPLGHRNTIKLDFSLNEKLVEDPVNTEFEPPYDDVPSSLVSVYTLNEILVEKIRSIMQRGHARDYYDVWRLLDEGDFDANRIRGSLIRKCELTGVDYRPGLIFDDGRLSEAEAHWDNALGRLTPELPAFELVIEGLRNSLKPILGAP